jgi:prepilin-type processing-associated H-X9-DG protein
MEPDLVGYVLNALDPPTQAGVDAYLKDHPAVQGRVDALRQVLEPLALDPPEAPPAGLADRTMAFALAGLGPAVADAAAGKLPGGWPLRRILEVAAIAALTVTVAGGVVAWVGKLRNQRPGEVNAVEVVECKDNLSKTFKVLRSYCDFHNRQFPNVDAANVDPPRKIAGLVYPILYDSQKLPTDMKLACPAMTGPAPCLISVNDVRAMKEPEFQGWAQGQQSCYAYTLGYKSGGQIVAPRLDDGKPTSLMPLMADSSPPDPQRGNSLNHGGKGQNVLYCDGHVAFCQSRYVGYNQDDIYLNRNGKVAAGVDWYDAVLTSSASPP